MRQARTVHILSRRKPVACSPSVCQELDAILKKEAPAPTRSNGVDGRSSAAGPTQSKDHIKNVVAPVNLDLSMSLESFRDASSRLRGLLLSLGTHVSSAQESVEIAPAGEQGEKS